MRRADSGTKTLGGLQRWMRRVLESRDGTAGAPERVARLTDRLVVPSATLAPRERVDIYARMYAYRLQEALSLDFPAVAAAIGEERFWSLTRDYVADRPSRGSNLNAYSAGFPAYVARRRGLPGAAFLAELAALEWALVAVVHERSAAPPALEHLTNATAAQWEGARFVLAPATRLLAFRYPVDAFYRAFREGARPRRPGPRATWVVVHRRGFVVW